MADDEAVQQVRVSDLLAGATLHPLRDGDTVVFAYLLLRTTTPEGTRWVHRVAGDSVNPLELYGAMIVQTEFLRQELVVEWFPEDDDPVADDSAPAEGSKTREERMPVGGSLGDLLLPALRTTSAIDTAFVLLKGHDGNGTWWGYRTSAPPVRQELLGALALETERLRDAARGLIGPAS